MILGCEEFTAQLFAGQTAIDYFREGRDTDAEAEP